MAHRVHLPGLVRQPGRVLARAEVFALTSSVEGFPNALLEAMACGCACVSFDCPSGPADMLEHGVSGLLVPPGDTTALAAAIRTLMGQPALRASLSARAREVKQRFAPAVIFEQWNTLLESLR